MIAGYFTRWNAGSRKTAQRCIRRARIFGDTAIRPFTFTAPLRNDTGPSAEPLSIVHPAKPGEFHAIYVSPDITLFTNAWSAALLRQLNRNLDAGGSLCLPYCAASDGAPAKVGWHLGWLTERLGVPQRTMQCRAFRDGWMPWPSRPATSMACFSKVDRVTGPSSVLDWWFHDHSKTKLEDVAAVLGLATPFASDLSKAGREFLLSDANVPAPKEPDATSDAIAATERSSDSNPELKAALQNHFSTMSYSLTGTSYKSAILQYIIETLVPRGRPLRLIDHGGGLGLLAIELLLENPRIEKAVNCDVSSRNLMLSARVFDFHRESILNRYYMQLQASQEFAYEDRYDLVSFIGSLLYFPRECISDSLERAWDALNPGGLLVVHENIKNRSYKRDYDVMFTVGELHGYLQRLGDIRFFASTRRQELTLDQVDSKSVFRVVQKPV